VPYTLTLGPAGYTSDAASERLFGGNVVFTRDYVDVGGPFEWVVDTLGLRSLRFPGGTVTETSFSPGEGFVDYFFDVTNPDGFDPDGSGRILTTPAFLQFAASRDLPVKYVLPTDNYLSSVRDADGNRLSSSFGLYRLVDRADRIMRGEYGEANIETFLLGNEFWYLDQRLNPTEYGRFANDLIKGLQFIFDRYREEQPDPDAWVEPNIAIQAGRGWIPLENQQVLAQLDMEARGSVDTVLQHFYPVYYQHVANSRGVFDRMDEFQNAEGFGDLNYYMSEWNTFMSPEADKGLMQASTLLETMRTMMLRGVDEASIWGIQYEQLNGRLATRITNPDGTWDSTLTAGGEVFRMMNPGIVGMQVLNIDTPAALRTHLLERPEERPAGSRDQAVMHAWGHAERTVIFLSSRTDTVMDFTVNVEGLIPANWHHAWLLQMGVMDDPTTARNEGDPTVNFARPHLTTESGPAFIADNTFNLTLGPWEVARLEFLHGDEGARMWSQEFLVDPAVDHSETMVGSRNDDTIFGGLGNDTLLGGAGNDILFSGPGNNQVFGEDGDDLIIGWHGENQLSGGAGMDRFAVSVLGTNVITDFRPNEGETLSFLGHYATADEVLARTTVGSWAGSGPAQDLIITHDDGGETVLLGGAQYSNQFRDSLSDFEPGSETVTELQELGLYEIPIERPDLPEPSVSDPRLLNELTRLATDGTQAEFGAVLDTFTDEQLADFVADVNPTIFSRYTSTALGQLLNRIDNDAVDDFFSRVWPGTFDLRVTDRLAQGVPAIIQNEYAFLRIIDLHSPEFGVQLAANPSDVHQNHLSFIFRTLQNNGVDPDDVAMFSLLDVRQDENGQYFVQQPPPPPPEEDDPPPTAGSADCFVATAVYGDRLHPDVAALRWFRYAILSQTRAGRVFCYLYYHHAGPWMAQRLERRPRLRRMIRNSLSAVAHHIRRRHGENVWAGRSTGAKFQG
jgi:hypothetical protein